MIHYCDFVVREELSKAKTASWRKLFKVKIK